MILVGGTKTLQYTPGTNIMLPAGVLLVNNLVSEVLGSAAALPVCSSNVLRMYCVPDA
jgi:hypothetical protein